MKKTKVAWIVILCVVFAALVACTQPETASPSSGSSSAASAASQDLEPEQLKQRYIRPLGPTTIIGMPWADASEVNPDDVLVTMEIMVAGNAELEKKYVSEDGSVMRIPEADAEAYAAQYFGMTPEQLQKASAYDAAAQAYIIGIGIGGAWGVDVTGGEMAGDLLNLQYNLIDAMDEIAGNGVMTIKLNQDGSYQYLSNVQEPGAWE